MWISPSLCSFPDNKCGTKFQNLLVAAKVCVYVGREVFLFCKFLLKKKIELQSLARFLIYIKWGIEEMECFFTHQHLTHTKISFLIKQHQGILQSEFSFLAIANKTCYCLLFWGKLLVIGISISSCLWTFFRSHLCRLGVSPIRAPQLSSVPPPERILTLFQFSSREVSWIVPQKLGSLDREQLVCHVWLFKWCLERGWSFN